MVGLKGLAAKLFTKNLAKEFDTESEVPADDDSDNQNGGDDAGSDSDASAPEDTQDTEHYVQVGKSKLRRNEPVALGLAYRGKRVSRKQLEEGDNEDEDEDDEEDEEDEDEEEDEEFDDPDEVDIEGAEEVHTDDEIDSDEAFGEDDEDIIAKFTFRGSAKPKTPKGKPVYSDDEDEEDEEEDEEEEDNEEEEEESEGGEIEDLASSGDDDEEDDEDDEDEDDEELDAKAAKAEEEARKILAQERRQVLSSISASAKADADKGFAVRQQRRTFDALLNMRIRMQKALSTANTLHTVAKDDDTSTSTDEAVEEAAAKAIELLNSIQSIRKSFYDAGDSSTSATTPKRKRRSGAFATDSSCQAIFDEMTVAEEAASAKRRKVIDRWAARVQKPSAASAAAASRRFTAAASSQPLTTVLDGQLVAPERLVKRTRTPRSCAPVQAAKKVEEDPEIYDDADFYQLLLKELVDQRTVDGTAPGSTAPTVRWAATAAQDAKTRKLVDRKASKGRKMRFNVHAKLQNFTAPEDRREWEPEAIDRFFSSLFGQRMALAEDDGADDEDADEDTEMGGASVGEGLRLF